MSRKNWLLSAAAVLLLVAFVLPSGWYDTIPRKPGMVLPVSGVLLLKLTFVVEALALVVVAFRGATFSSLTSNRTRFRRVSMRTSSGSFRARSRNRSSCSTGV